jgi:adenylate cyclase
VTPSGLRQRLAAILAADAVGYSRLMSVDQFATVADLDAGRAVFRREIEARGGRVVDMAGDSILAVFELATSAVAAALAIQQALNASGDARAEDRRLRFRIGIHIGEIIEKADGTVYGDGVNIAARLEGVAEPGAVAISDAILALIRGKLNAVYVDLGEQRVKNIAAPVRAYRAGLPGTDPRAPAASSALAAAKPADRPSLAVLPFNNLSGDSEQEYFADGIVEDLVSALSRFRWLLVIARNSTFVYKGKAVDVRQVARELGVRYMLEGSVRKAGSRVRIVAQLIDAPGGTHIWSHRYDRDLSEVFDLQDEITQQITAALAPEITAAEIARVQRQRPDSLDSWDAYVRALPLMREHTREANRGATELLEKAIRLSPGYAAAFARLSGCRTQAAYYDWDGQRDACISEALDLGRRAQALDPEEPLALDALASAYQISGDLENAATLARRAIVLSSACTAAYGTLITSLAFLGRWKEALEVFADSERTSPRDPDRSSRLMGLTIAHFVAGHYADVVESAKDYVSLRPNWYGGYVYLAAANALSGNLEAANAAVRKLLQLRPDMTLAGMRKQVMLRHPPDAEKLLEGLREAGLPT